MGPEEICFQMQYSTQAVADLLASVTEKVLREGTHSIYKRLAKHFSKHVGEKAAAAPGQLLSPVVQAPESGGFEPSDDVFRQQLFLQTWAKTKAFVGDQYAHFVDLIGRCYPRLRTSIPVPVGKVASILEAADRRR
eukprot:NODE_4583_length_568_cov_184.485549_g3334_i0.p1 GENE.NODE_4583_length_568_cov_184.485549_g3334_i0~~NODE_4583_length_568_cov_184.485549_g3334_i0.p1  ORF type:complete len:143 (+),score=52.14 NODE_4583_length_568_cov_184.485549_g3334_i0:24-431(+)